MTSTSSPQDPSASPAPFARGFKEMQGVHVLLGHSALHGFPLQQRGSWGFCSYARAMSSQTQVPGLLISKGSRQIRGMQGDLMVCTCSAEKRGELQAPKVLVEIQMWNRYHGNLWNRYHGCYLVSLSQQEGGRFSDGHMSPVLPVCISTRSVLLWQFPGRVKCFCCTEILEPPCLTACSTLFFQELLYECVCAVAINQLLGSDLASPFLTQRGCVEFKICFTKAKSLLALARSLQTEKFIEIFTGPTPA